MKTLLKSLTLSAAIMTAALPVHQVQAQTTTLNQIADPAAPTAPTAPSGASDSYDKVAIEQIMKVVDLMRSVGGGILQLITTVEAQQKSLDSIRDANVGTKTFPTNNTGADVTDREGGTGLKDMSDAATSGAVTGPQGVIDAIEQFRPTFNLDKAFALVTDPSPNKVLIGHLTGMGAIAAATGDDSYKRSNASMSRIDGYILALQNSADLKTSIDINTRVQLEAVQTMNEMLRTQSAIAAAIGSYYMLIGAEHSEPDGMEKLQDFNR